MLRLPPFKYYAPKTLGQAVKILADHGSEAMLVAGGTDVLPKMKRRQFRPKVLISLRGIKKLMGIKGSKNRGFVIKAGTTLSEIAAHSVIQKAYPGLEKAVCMISTPILRHMGTIGGNLCLDTRCNYYDQTYHWRQSVGWCLKAPGPQGVLLNPNAPQDHGAKVEAVASGSDVGGTISWLRPSVPCRVAPASPRCWAVASADTPPMLIALDAQIRLVSARGERVISVKELYRDDGLRYLTKAPDEILKEIIIPPADGLKTTYWKLRRRGAFDFPVLGVAVALKQESGTVTQAKIVLTGVGSCPVEIEQAEKILINQKLTPDVIEAAAQAAFSPARPLDNTDFHLFYRKRMALIYVKRALMGMK